MVICPNIGVLTSVVLALIPLMRPFAWQHLMMPVLPATEETLDILEVRCCVPPGFWAITAWISDLCYRCPDPVPCQCATVPGSVCFVGSSSSPQQPLCEGAAVQACAC